MAGDFNDNFKPKQKPKINSVNLNETRFPLIRKIFTSAGFSVDESKNFNRAQVIWTDNTVPADVLSKLKPNQRINRIPGMHEISRKDYLYRNYSKIERENPQEFSFVPRTWILPKDSNLFYSHLKSRQKDESYYILKPASGASGQGIRIIKSFEQIINLLKQAKAMNSVFIVQNYIDNPMLIEGYKFDLRIYVLITNVEPLRIFMYNEGLVRLCSEQYAKPSKDVSESLYKHLTNYSMNKHHEKYDLNSDEWCGSKRSFSFLDSYLKTRYMADSGHVWREIRSIIVKTILMAQPHLCHAYRSCKPHLRRMRDSQVSLFRRSETFKSSMAAENCFQSCVFEILGFDILLDENLQPWLLEVNRFPSFSIQQEIDRKVKGNMLKEAIILMQLKQKGIKMQNNKSSDRFFKEKAPSLPKKVNEKKCTSYAKQKEFDEKFSSLVTMLKTFRLMNVIEFYENKHMGMWRRIFPDEDRFQQNKYLGIMKQSLSIFHAGQRGKWEQDFEKIYEIPSEDVILSQLRQLQNEAQSFLPSSMFQNLLRIMDAAIESEDESSSSSDSVSGTPIIDRPIEELVSLDEPRSAQNNHYNSGNANQPQLQSHSWQSQYTSSLLPFSLTYSSVPMPPLNNITRKGPNKKLQMPIEPVSSNPAGLDIKRNMAFSYVYKKPDITTNFDIP